jgi:hypothetical protein
MGRLALDHLQRLVGLARDDHRPTRLDDPGLLPGDLGQARAQHLQVVVVHRRDHADRRGVEDVGGVEAPAQPHLHDADVGRRLGEGQVGQHGGDLEEADRLARVGRLQPVGEVFQLFVGDQLAGQPDPLGEPHQVRRGQGMHAQARRLSDGAQVGHRRALAVGAGHVDRSGWGGWRAAAGSPRPRRGSGHASNQAAAG